MPFRRRKRCRLRHPAKTPQIRRKVRTRPKRDLSPKVEEPAYSAGVGHRTDSVIRDVMIEASALTPLPGAEPSTNLAPR
jgi:hypothetical protein